MWRKVGIVRRDDDLVEAAGLIEGRWEDLGGNDAARQRKYYSITRKGRRELAHRAEEWRQFAGAVTACLGGV